MLEQHPICIIGNAGTVNTGAVDDLDALADLAVRENLWFHVDGALGAPAALVPELRPLLSGLSRADSLAFDFHKWLYMPYEVGCILVRDEPAHRQTFAYQTEYLAQTRRGIAARASMYSEYGVQLSRGFRALKVWMNLKAYGVERFRRLIGQNAEQARYLAARIDESPQLKGLAPVSLNVVCFRYIGGIASEEQIDRLNRELLCELHESGIAAPSYTILDNVYCLRVCITNHRSRRADFDLLLDAVLRIGERSERALKSG
jgi:glutamate/tyrosine decarboxylase-like PLP-dependent enzyme